MRRFHSVCMCIAVAVERSPHNSLMVKSVNRATHGYCRNRKVDVCFVFTLPQCCCWYSQRVCARTAKKRHNSLDESSKLVQKRNSRGAAFDLVLRWHFVFSLWNTTEIKMLKLPLSGQSVAGDSCRLAIKLKKKKKLKWLNHSLLVSIFPFHSISYIFTRMRRMCACMEHYWDLVEWNRYECKRNKCRMTLICCDRILNNHTG